MTVSAAPGTYVIEVSDDLASWVPLDELVIDGFSGTFSDPTSLSLDRRFYQVEGSFESSDYHSIDLYHSVESGATNGWLYSGYRRHHTLRLSNAGIPSTRLQWMDTRMSDIRLQSGGDTKVSAFIESEFAGGPFLVDTLADRLDVSFPGFSQGNPFEYQETRLPFEYTAHAINNDLTTLVGGGVSEYTITENQEVTNGREVFLSLMGRKSRDASLGALEGAWGGIRYLVEASDWGANYNVGAYAFDVNSTAGEFQFSYVREVEFEQIFNPSQVHVNLEHEDGADQFALTIDLQSDGSVNINDEIHGFVSSSADFLVGVSVDPSLFDQIEVDESIEVNEEEAASMFLIAVPRDTNPQLAGRSYRMIGMGTWITPSNFETVTQPYAENTLVFSADGTTVDITYQGNGFNAGFGGGGIIEAIDPPQTVTLNVAVDANGLVRMNFETEDFEVAIFGFARKGGDVLVLGGGYRDEDVGGMDSLIAIEIDD